MKTSARFYEDIARRCELSRTEATKDLAREVLPCGGGFACFAGKGGFANRVVGIGGLGTMTTTPTEAEIDRVLRFYDERGIEETVVEISAYANPDLIKLLSARGFVLKHVIHVLALELGKWEPPQRVEIPKDMHLARLDDKSDTALLREIVEANERGFVTQDSKLLPEVSIELALKALSSPSTTGFFVRAKSNSEIVAVGLSDVRSGLATLFGATTNPEFRNKGLHRALMTKRIEQARGQGCDHAVILAGPGKTTEHNAIALGFEMATTILALTRPSRLTA